MLSQKRIEKIIKNRIVNNDKIKKKKQLKKANKLKSKKEKTALKNSFGKLRYYLSFWFGNWVLMAFNKPRKD